MTPPDNQPPPSGIPAEGPPPAGSQPRILLVDDDLINQKVMVNLLKRKGWIATAAGSGPKCLELLQQQPFDLILLDIQMPQMDGFTTATEVRRQESTSSPHRRIPIVALTTIAQPGTREKCIACGMDDHLTKPVNTAELYATIQRILCLPS